MQNLLKKLLPSLIICSYRKIRLLVKSWVFLPPLVRIISNGKEARLSTRGFPTANLVFWLKTKDVLDYEPEERALLEPLLRDVRCFWDIGAQIGFYSIVAALHGVSHILAVDIDKRYCEEIRKHAKANRLNIQVLNAAIGISGEKVKFENYGAITELKAISLDDLVKTTGLKPDLIKIDIDGGEMAMLRGAPELLSAPLAPAIVMELLSQHNNIVEVKKILEGYGYRLIKRAGNNTLWQK